MPEKPSPFEQPFRKAESKSSTDHLSEEMESLVDTFDLILDAEVHSFGYVVTEPQTHGWAIQQIQSALDKVQPQVLTPDSADEAHEVAASLLRNGQRGEHNTGTTLLDLSQLDYDSSTDQTSIEMVLSSLNLGRNPLINSAMLTVIIVPSAKFDLYQNLPDLFSCRSFVARFPEAEK